VAGSCECGDEPSGSCATELVGYVLSFAVVCRIVSVYFVFVSLPINFGTNILIQFWECKG
jgi:hypothetical protein